MDGIIQQTISAFVGKHKYKTYSWIIDDADMKALQQEIIEKIKQSFGDNESIVNVKSEPTGLFHKEDILTKLIGDNQE